MKRSDVQDAMKLDRKLVALDKQIAEVTALMKEGVAAVRVRIGGPSLEEVLGGAVIAFPAERAGAVHAEITAELCRQRDDIVIAMTKLGITPPDEDQDEE